MKLSNTLFSAMILLSTACGDEEPVPPVPVAAKAVRFQVTHATSTAYAPAEGPLAFASQNLVLAATLQGISAYRIGATATPVAGGQWALTSTGSGPAASSIVIAPNGARAYFLESGTPQLGAIELAADGTGTLVGEAVLSAPLSTTFPAGILAPNNSDALFIADAPFGPGSVLRAYLHSSWNGSKLTEDPSRSFTPPTADLNGDMMPDAPVIGRATATDDGTIGLVSFSVLGGTAIGVAGGVDIVDLATGDALGRVVARNANTATTTLGFVSAARAYNNLLVVIIAEKGPNFVDLEGQIAIYRVASWRPFSLASETPAFKLATKTPNPVGLSIVEGRALVLEAPFFSAGSVEVIDLTKETPISIASLDIGMPYVDGFVSPQDPVVAPDKSAVLIGTEGGVVRLGVEIE